MIGTAALDAALNHIRDTASRLDICSSLPRTYAETMAASLGFTQTFTVSKPRDCDGGRCIDVTDIRDGKTTRNGLPMFWVLTGKSQILAADRITDGRQLTQGLGFMLPAIEVELTNTET